jgi:hypothetical protein
MMDIFAQLDTIKQKQLAHRISFNVTKCIVGYVQQITIFAEQKWAVTYFSEVQLLSFLADLESDRALIWNGTDPNTQRKGKCFILPVLTKAAYGTWIKRDSSLKMPP